MTITTFFGDGEHRFALTTDLIRELQTKTGVGFGALIMRVLNKQYGVDDIIETIRLALIGGGKSPIEADALVKTYAHNRPLAETLPVAIGILEAAFFGAPQKDSTDGQA